MTHGEMIDVARFVLERLTPAEWLAKDADPAYRVSNRQILHHTRRDPHGGGIEDRIRWVRSVCPGDEASRHGGEWVEIHRRLYSDAELTTMVERHPLLLEPSATDAELNNPQARAANATANKMKPIV